MGSCQAVRFEKTFFANGLVKSHETRRSVDFMNLTPAWHPVFSKSYAKPASGYAQIDAK
jgi:hypothetical protein